ncbi:His Kinase A (phospho-acceptor) domain-containing protein [Pedobacter terrae]|uniref:histidine kinase n=2 Tax=Pedobacter terrae TaxID=405671 RepID=A0A1G7NRN7_9SPHI|nr:His Kinase A (phospho-acceptor) domain-containing protein [Pedobacter terrae]
MRCLDQVENADAKDILDTPLRKLQELSSANNIFFIELKDAVTAIVTYAFPGPASLTMIDPSLFENISGTMPIYLNGVPFSELNTRNSEMGSTIVLPLMNSNPRSCVVLIWHEPIKFSPEFKEFIEISYSVLRRVARISAAFYSIEQLEVYFNAILQTVPQSIIFIDDSGSRSWVNENASRLLDLPSGIIEPGLLHSKMQSFRSLASNREEIFERGMEIFQLGRKVTGDWKWIYSDPEPRVLNVYCTPVESKSIQGVLWMFDDITDKHFADQEIHDLNIKLKLASDYKSQFLANMSHELRTPLNSIIVLADLLSENNECNYTSKQVGYAKIISNAGKDLLYLINDILDLAKIEAGKMDLNFEAESTKEIVQSVQGLFTEVAHSKNINFSIKVSPLLPNFIMTDRLRLAQIFKNLLSNAFKFTPEGGSVEFSLDCKPEKNILVVRVSDNGIGIDSNKKNEIFEAFKQADGTTSRNFGGTGLGLSITKELVWRFDGNILVESALGLGSTFIIEMPLKRAEEVMADQVPLPASSVHPISEPDPTKYQELNQRRILVATGDIREVFLFNTALTNCGAFAKHASSVEELKQELLIENPEIIILDLNVFSVDAGALKAQLRNERQALKIIALSATALQPEELVSAELDAVLHRPVDALHLLNTIKHLLKST